MIDKLLSNKRYTLNKNEEEKANSDSKNKDNKKKELYNPFKNALKGEDITDNKNTEEDDIGMCKLVLRKLINDFTYERVLSTIPQKSFYMNSLLERPIDTLRKKYKLETINKAMKELDEELEKQGKKKEETEE